MKAVTYVVVFGAVIGLIVTMSSCRKPDTAAEKPSQNDDRHPQSPELPSATKEDSRRNKPKSDAGPSVPVESTDRDPDHAENEKVISREDDQLQGEWVVVSVDIADAPQQVLDVMKSLTITFTESKVTMVTQPGGQLFLDNSYTFDPTKNPSEINLTPNGDVKNGGPETPIMPGIYELTGDSLKLCLAPNQGERREDPETGDANVTSSAGKRPTGFDGEQGMLFVLRRKER